MTLQERGGRSNPPTDHDPSVRLGGIHQLLAVLPHLMGYRPDHSIVLVVTRPAGSPRPGTSGLAVVCTARLDLPPVEHLGTGVVDALLPALSQVADEGPTLLHLFGYDLPESGTGADRDVSDEAERGLARVGREMARRSGSVLHDLVLLRDESRSLREVVASGEPVLQGHWIEAPVAADVPATADLVLRGRSAVGSRSDVVRQVRHLDEGAVSETDLAISVLSLAPERLDDAEALRALAGWVLDGRAPSARQRAWITLVLHDTLLRDAVLARWAPAVFRLEDLLDAAQKEDFCRWVPAWESSVTTHAGLERLLVLVSQVPRGLAAPLLTLTGLISWARGEGTIANETCDLALEVDPDYSMATLLRRALSGGLRPPRPGEASGRDGAGHPGRRPAA